MSQDRTEMRATRLEAFSDGVIAVIITIMVLELHVPHEDGLAGLWSVAPRLGIYLLSFSDGWHLLDQPSRPDSPH